MRTLETKRKLAAWLLLSVFIPMMAVTVLHRHQPVIDVDNECVQCEHHLPHAGHLSAQSVALDDCLLCQLSSLPCLLPVAVLQVLVSYVQPACPRHESQLCPVAVTGIKSPRAPPFVIV